MSPSDICNSCGTTAVANVNKAGTSQEERCRLLQTVDGPIVKASLTDWETDAELPWAQKDVAMRIYLARLRKRDSYAKK